MTSCYQIVESGSILLEEQDSLFYDYKQLKRRVTRTGQGKLRYVTTYEYARDRLVLETESGTDHQLETKYRYNSQGKQTLAVRVGSVNGLPVQYEKEQTYDAKGRLASVRVLQDSINEHLKYEYGANREISHAVYYRQKMGEAPQDSLLLSYEWDQAGRLEKYSISFPDGSLYYSEGFKYRKPDWPPTTRKVIALKDDKLIQFETSLGYSFAYLKE